MRRLSVFIVLIGLLVAAMSLRASSAQDTMNTEGIPAPPGAHYTVHTNVIIEGDSQFTAPNGVVSGTGKWYDPYLISGWDINTTHAIGVWVRNTTMHFIIDDCYFHAWIMTFKGHAAVHLTNAVNGQVNNSNLNGAHTGISIYGSTNITVQNCGAIKNAVGMIVNNTRYATIRNNTLRENSMLGLRMEKDASIPTPGYNRVYYNIFNFNGMGTLHATDNSPMNIWNASDKGNKWFGWTSPDVSPKDGIVDVPYDIPGSSGNKDYKPIADTSMVIELGPFVVLAFGSFIAGLLIVVRPGKDQP